MAALRRGQVVQAQSRDGRQGFRAVRRGLGLLQAQGFFHQRRAPLRPRFGLDIGQAGAFRLFADFAQAGVRQQDHGSPVLVV